MMQQHQYIDRKSGKAVTETLVADRSIAFLYHQLREQAPFLFRLLTSKRMSGLLGFFHYDINLPLKNCRGQRLFERMGIDWRDCVHPVERFATPRQVFERQIRYEEVRPMDAHTHEIVSPADARMVCGSFSVTKNLFIKTKFFSQAELLGENTPWLDRFEQADFAVFRLTPDKYHYNHVPVTGEVVDVYCLDGRYHSCNPEAVLALASLQAKNRRVVTIIDTDVEGGTGIGLVAMIEVVALMIGDIVQCYSQTGYDRPQPVVKGMRLEQGCPKSLYRPGSSTDILLFQRNRISFCADLLANQARQDVSSRLSTGFGCPMVETEVQVRSTIASRCNDHNASSLPPSGGPA